MHVNAMVEAPLASKALLTVIEGESWSHRFEAVAFWPSDLTAFDALRLARVETPPLKDAIAIWWDRNRRTVLVSKLGPFEDLKVDQ